MSDAEYYKVYEQLQDISEYESDIYDGAEFQKILEEKELLQKETSKLAGLKMQLAAESYCQLFKNTNINPEAGLKEDKLLEWIRALINHKLSMYSMEERRVYLINMIENARIWQNNFVEAANDEETVIRLQQMNLNELEQILVKTISDISVILVEQIEVGQLTASETAVGKMSLEEGGFCLGAGACSAYVCEEKLRETPEVIGYTSGAAFCVQQYKNEKEPVLLNVIGMALQLAAASMVTTLVATAAVAGGVSLISFLPGEFALSLATAGYQMVMSLTNVYKLELAVFLGMGATGELVKAVNYMKERRNKNRPVSDQQLQTEDETEDDEDYASVGNMENEEMLDADI